MSASSKQPAVSKPMLVLLVVAVLVLIWLLIPTDNQTALDVKQPAETNSMVAAKKTPKLVQPVMEKEVTSTTRKSETNRNPFEAPAIVRLRLAKDTNSNQRTNPVVSRTDQSEVQVNQNQPVWKGIMGTVDDQLAIVAYKSRTYFLRLGDKLGSSGYRLTGFSAGKIVLSSAKGELRLEREAKKK